MLCTTPADGVELQRNGESGVHRDTSPPSEPRSVRCRLMDICRDMTGMWTEADRVVQTTSQLKPFFLSLLPQAPCGRRGLSTTSSLRDSEAESRVDVYD